MGILDIFFNKWTHNEKIAYLKAQINLSSSDGNVDDEEIKSALENMKIIKWIPADEIMFEKYKNEAQNMSTSEGISIIKNMTTDKKKIVSIGLKSMALSDKKLVESETLFLRDFELKTGIPQVTFSKIELANFEYTEKEKSVVKDKPSKNNQINSSDFHQNYQTLDLLISSHEGMDKDYKFLKLVEEKKQMGSIRNEEQLNNFILSFLSKFSTDEVIAKMVNFQTLENILGSSLNEYDEKGDTSFKGYKEIEQYHTLSIRSYQLCNQFMLESMIKKHW